MSRENEIDPSRIFNGREMIITDKICMPEPRGIVLIFRVVGLDSTDGAFFLLDEGQMTNAVKIVMDCTVEEEVVHGKAWLLTLSTEGIIECKLKDTSSGPVNFAKDEVAMWIAAERDTVIENKTTPKFTKDMEKEVEVGDPTIGPRFWELMVEPKEVAYYPIKKD